MSYLHDLYILKANVKRQSEKAKNFRWYDALNWAVSRLDPQMFQSSRVPACDKHTGNKKTYCITMWPEDHRRLVSLGKELHISGGLSGVLTYIAQNSVLIHEIDKNA